MKDKSALFSQEALDKLRTPERLDTIFSITRPVGWILILAVGVSIIGILLWSIFGAFTVKVDGMGLLMDSAGVSNVYVTNITGKVESILVSKGMKVDLYMPVARIESPNRPKINVSRKGLDLSSNEQDMKSKVQEYDISNIENVYNEYITSSVTGVVDEIIARPGQAVSPGAIICTVRRTQERNDLVGMLYIPVEMGKRVEPGMMVQVIPNGVDVTETGSLLGVVRQVSQYPVTSQQAQNNLGNPQLANWFFDKEKSSLMEVKFELLEDHDSESGYLWTSMVGRHKPVVSGSYCTGSIVIERKPPIERVFYKISQWLRNR